MVVDTGKTTLFDTSDVYGEKALYAALGSSSTRPSPGVADVSAVSVCVGVLSVTVIIDTGKTTLFDTSDVYGEKALYAASGASSTRPSPGVADVSAVSVYVGVLTVTMVVDTGNAALPDASGVYGEKALYAALGASSTRPSPGVADVSAVSVYADVLSVAESVGTTETTLPDTSDAGDTASLDALTALPDVDLGKIA
jgi:hypothetical protein